MRVQFFQRWSFTANPTNDSWLDMFTRGAFELVSSTASQWVIRGALTSWTRDYTFTFVSAGAGFSIVSGTSFPVGVMDRLEIHNASGVLIAVFEDMASLGLSPSAFRDSPASVLTGADVFIGSSGQDDFYGNGGDDTLHGSASGDSFGDHLYGGDGNDRLIGGARGDRLYGDAGDDHITVGGSSGVYRGDAYGGAGNDTLRDGLGDARGEDGNDHIENVTGLLDGGAGDDVLIGSGTLLGGDGSDRIQGGTGDDTIQGGLGYDHIYAGAGNDSITLVDADYIVAGAGSDSFWVNVTSSADYAGTYLDAGDEADVLDHLWFGSTSAAAQIVIGGTFDASGFALSGFEYIYLGNAGDTITTQLGYSLDMTIEGRGGDDRIQAGSGHDTLAGGDGNDVLEGQGGNDSLSGGSGDDELLGGTGDDRFYEQVINESFGNDIFDGGAGSDTVSLSRQMGEGQVVIDLNLTGPQDTGQGLDTFISIENLTVRTASRPTSIIGTDQANRFVVQSGEYVVEGRGGNDQIEVMYGVNTSVFGGDGDDIIFANFGLVALASGGDGDDQVSLQDGTASGGAGIDLLTVSAHWSTPDALQFDAATTTYIPVSSTTGVQFSGFERFDIVGSSHADTLRGGAYDDRFWGNGGDDILYGLDGDDYLEGGRGDDQHYGGDGDDEIWNGEGKDLLDGGAGSDTVQLFGFTDPVTYIAYGATVDLRIVGAQNTGQGLDTLVDIENLNGSERRDQLTGDAKDNRFDGMDGNDVLMGGDGNDILIGGAGNDQLVGGAGNDTLDGGAGWDEVVISGESDTYQIFQEGSGYRIKGAEGSDFLTGVEVLRFNDRFVDLTLVICNPNTGQVLIGGSSPLILPGEPVTNSKPSGPDVVPPLNPDAPLVLPGDLPTSDPDRIDQRIPLEPEWMDLALSPGGHWGGRFLQLLPGDADWIF